MTQLLLGPRYLYDFLYKMGKGKARAVSKMETIVEAMPREGVSGTK